MNYQVLQQTMENQAERINAVLNAHRVQTHVQNGSATARTLRYELSATPQLRVRQVSSLREELALVLQTDQLTVAREGGALLLELPHPEPNQILLRDVLADVIEMPSATACLGLLHNGRPLLLRLTSPNTAHILIAGATGCGKTELLRSILWSLLLNNRQSRLQWVAIDLKQRGLLPFAEHPALCLPFADTAERALYTLQVLVERMEQRDLLGVRQPKIVVAIDELAELLQLLGTPALNALTRLAQRGREAGIHLLLATQQPASHLLPGTLKANLPVRLVGKVTSPEEARMAAGVGGVDAEQLLGKGDFWAVAGAQRLRFQAAIVTANDWHTWQRT